MALETTTEMYGQRYFLRAPDEYLMERAFAQMRDNGLAGLRLPDEVINVVVEGAERPVARISVDRPEGQFIPHLGFYVMDGHDFSPYGELERTRDFLLDQCSLSDEPVPHYRIAIGARVLDDRGAGWTPVLTRF